MGPDIAPGSGVPLAGAPGSQGGFAMGLAVPGLTVPWGHAGYLWVATAASIAIHEVKNCLTQILHCSFLADAWHLPCPVQCNPAKHANLSRDAALPVASFAPVLLYITNIAIKHVCLSLLLPWGQHVLDHSKT